MLQYGAGFHNFTSIMCFSPQLWSAVPLDIYHTALTDFTADTEHANESNTHAHKHAHPALVFLAANEAPAVSTHIKASCFG